MIFIEQNSSRVKVFEMVVQRMVSRVDLARKATYRARLRGSDGEPPELDLRAVERIAEARRAVAAAERFLLRSNPAR